MIARGSASCGQPHHRPHRSRNDKTCLDEKAPTSLLECAVYLSARKKLIHAMSRDIDRPINRAVVVGCAISATRNSLKLHMPRTLKVLLCNAHAKTRKLWSVLPSCRLSKQYPSINSPRHPLPPRLPRCPLHYLRFPGMQTFHVASCSRRAYHRERRRH
jgi:hypothetical protein